MTPMATLLIAVIAPYVIVGGGMALLDWTRTKLGVKPSS